MSDDIGIGETLRTAREQQGRTIEEAARDTRVRSDYLRALEEERFDAIGGDVYAKGFLSSYARYLQLDPAPLLERYRRYVQHHDYDPAALATGPVAKLPSGSPPTWLAWAVVAVALFAGAVVLVNTLGGRIPPPAEEDDSSTLPVATTSPTAPSEPGRPEPTSPEPSPTPTPQGVRLLLTFEERSWVRISVDGIPHREGIIEAGEALDLQGEETIEIRFGNPGGVRAQLNGEDLGRVGERGVPRTVTFTRDGVTEA